jgi:hypothetical protein
MSYKNKLRTLRELKNGRRQTISLNILNKFNWTEEELKHLHDNNYVNTYDAYSYIEPDEDTLNDDSIVTKYEIYEHIDALVDNEFTKRNYKSRVNMLLKIMEIQDENFANVFVNLDELSSKIYKNYKDSTAYFAFMLWIISNCDKLKTLYHDKFFDKIKSEFEYCKNKQTIKSLNDRNEQTEEYKKVYHTIFDIERTYKEKDYASIKHLISVLYTHCLYDKDGIIHINPRNYFLNVILIDNDDELKLRYIKCPENDDTENFYIVDSGRLVLNKYKTSGIYKPYDVYVTQYVMDVINKSIELFPRKYLIAKYPSGELYASNALSEKISKILKYNIDIIRKSIESYEINIKNTCRLHLAAVSRHSVVTQEISYLSK